MNTPAPQTIYLKDYTPPAYLIDTVDLDFSIETGSTVVKATLAMRRNPVAATQALVLNGEELETLNVAVDGQKRPRINADTQAPHKRRTKSGVLLQTL